MKRSILFITLAMMAASSCLFAQRASTPFGMAAAAAPDGYTSTSAVRAPAATGPSSFSPLSRIAFGGGISSMGINMQTAVNANRFMNVRAVGNVFNYSVNNLTTNGMNVNGSLGLASLGTSVDIYPFPEHGFRLSPGLMFLNHNGVSGDVTVNGGKSFDLNGVTYYASSTNPIKGNGKVGLNSRNPAFTMTTGWGNMIPRSGGRLSFPVEVGAAFVGSPSVALQLTGGQACDQFRQNCVNVATDPTVQANLQAQIQKYKNDLNAFQYFPIVSFGVAYNFNLHPQGAVR